MVTSYVLLLTFLFTVVIAEENEREYRIIKGVKSIPGQFPYMISIQHYDTHHCGGTIIDKLWSLSAAHCFFEEANSLYSLSSLTIIVGSVYTNVGNTYRIKTVYTHEMFNLDQLVNDIALLQVEKPFEFNTFVQPVPLNADKLNDDDEELEVTIIGWGYTSDSATEYDVLPVQQFYINVHTIPKEACSNAFSDVTDDTICVFDEEGKGSCVGDSGSPLVHEGQQIGILSYGEEKCLSTTPEVHTRLSSYYQWIVETIKNNTEGAIIGKSRIRYTRKKFNGYPSLQWF